MYLNQLVAGSDNYHITNKTHPSNYLGYVGLTKGLQYDCSRGYPDVRDNIYLKDMKNLAGFLDVCWQVKNQPFH